MRLRCAATRFMSLPMQKRYVRRSGCTCGPRIGQRARLYGTGSVTVHWTDPVDRSQSYIPMASPFVSKLAAIAARVHSECPFDVIYSHYLEPYGVAGHLAAQMIGVPHVVRMAGSDAGRLWHHPQFEALYDHVLRSAEVVIAAGPVAERAIHAVSLLIALPLAANSCCRKTCLPRTVRRSTSRHCGRRSNRTRNSVIWHGASLQAIDPISESTASSVKARARSPCSPQCTG